MSQLLRALEQRVGARLIERTSRKVTLTPLGADFLADLRPAYAALRATVDGVRAAARGTEGVLRIGVQGSSTESLTAALALFERRFPACVTEVVEIPLADPFGPVQRSEVDIAVVLLPMGESDLVLGQVFSEQPQLLAMHNTHPLAARTSLSPEDLAEFALIGVHGPAPHYWRRAQSLDVTPGGRPVQAGPGVGTLREGIELVAAGQGAMLLCHPTAVFHDRPEVEFVPVAGLAHSRMGLVWHRNRETATVRAFSGAVAAVS